MDLTKLRYFQWVLISLVVGVTTVGLRAWASGLDGATSVPADLSGQQRRFEKALLGQVEGHALMRNIRVSPLRVATSSGGARAAHLVRADCCTGEPELHDGRREYVWRESLFVLPAPYHVGSNLGEADPAVGSELAKRAGAGGEQTVLDLLAAARSAHGTRYSYAWWDSHPWLTFGGASVLVIGFVVPALLHLLAFGQLTRPAEADPRPVYLEAPRGKPERRHDQPTSPEILHADVDDSEMKASETEAADTRGCLTSTVQLQRNDSLASAAETSAQDADYRMKPDDYYPTERGPGSVPIAPK